jgi:hypothetical protein
MTNTTVSYIKLINISFDITKYFYWLLFLFFNVRWLVFNRVTLAGLGMLYDVIVIYSIFFISLVYIVLKSWIKMTFIRKKDSILELIFNLLVGILLVYGIYFIISIIYLDKHFTVIHHWESGEWKW